MRRFVFLLLCCASTAAASEPFAVGIFSDRFTPPRRVEISNLPKNVDAVWVWTTDAPPQKIGVAALAAMKPLVARWVAVHAEPLKKSAPLNLIAAPVAMWEEVPEDLLPSYSVNETLRIAVDGRSRWRVRLRGAKLGSWWTDVAPGTSIVKIAAAAASDRHLVVQDEEQLGITNARLSVIDEGAERGDFRKLVDYRTDDKGRLVMRAVPDSSAITLFVASADRAPTVIETRPSAMPARMTLPRGNTVSGKLVDRFGLPVVNADITLRTWASELLPLPLVRRAVTGDDGHWQIAALPRGKGQVEASAATFADIQRPVSIAGDIDLGTIVFQPAVIAEILVSDDRGGAVSGAKINVGPKIAAVTDAKGHASMNAAPGESLDVRVSAPHHRMKTAKIESPPPKLTKIILERSFRVSGRFVDATGAGIAEARGRCKTSTRMEIAEVAADGRFDFELEAGADYHIELFSPTTAVATIDVAKGIPGETRDIGDVGAPFSLVVRGRLVGEDGTPVAGARVWLPRPSEAGPLMAWVFRDILETTTRANGEFELSGAPTAPFVLRIAAPALAAIRRAVTPAADATRVDLGDIVLKGGTTVTVTLDNGNADGAVAHVDLGGAGISIDMLEAPFVEGKATIPNVTSGPVTVSAVHGRDLLCRQPLTITADRPEIEVKCATHKVRVAGTVKIGGRPTGPGTLVWLSPAPPIGTGVFTFGSGAMQQQRVFSPESERETANVGPDGRFDGPSVLPGAWDVLWMPDTGRALGPKPITIGDGSTEPLIFEYPGVAVEGVVLDAQRKPVKGADVRNVTGGGFSLSRDDGTFTLAGPDPGTWKVQARYRGDASRVTDVVVEVDKQQPYVELVLGSDDARVRVAVGSGAMVFLESDTGRINLATTDSNGVASFRVVPPIPQKVRVASSVGGRWTLGEWISWDEATTGDVVLKPADSIGNVVLRTKGPTGAVTITSESGWRIDRLLQWLGSFALLAPENEVAISGLPPGTYNVSVANQQRTLSVEKQKTVDLVFE